MHLERDTSSIDVVLVIPTREYMLPHDEEHALENEVVQG
jgi:cellobiose-specific phosphotransferase system component IIB